jgi:predicted RNA binding protein YcfA (HicA-like mRNA interferase family)
MKSPQSKVVTLPAAPFLLELHSERMIDLMMALQDAGFKVTHISGSLNRYRVDDREPPP